MKGIKYFTLVFISIYFASCKEDIKYKYPYGKEFYGSYDTSISFSEAGLKFYPDSIYKFYASGCTASFIDSGYFHISNDTIKFTSLFKEQKDSNWDSRTQIRLMNNEVFLRKKNKIYIARDSTGNFDTTFYWKKRSINLN